MSRDLDNVLNVLLLIDRLAALIQTLGARVRQAQAEGRPITDAELDAQHEQAENAILAAVSEISAKRARG